jgi:Na+/H+ antiporter NhaB
LSPPLSQQQLRRGKIDPNDLAAVAAVVAAVAIALAVAAVGMMGLLLYLLTPFSGD